MHPILDRLHASRARLLAVVEPLTEADLDRPAAGEWTIRQILMHLIASEDDHRRVVEAILRGESDRLPHDFSLDAHNAHRLAEVGWLEREALQTALQAQRARTLALAEGLDDEALAQRGRHPALGEMSVGDILRIIAVHELRHLRDIQAALGG